MKKVQGIEAFHWHRFKVFSGEEYAPYYFMLGAVTIGAVMQCTGKFHRRWSTWVLPKTVDSEIPREKLRCYARSKARAMYFVESWAKYHGKR